MHLVAHGYWLILHTLACFYLAKILLCFETADQLLTWCACDRQVALTRQGLPEKALQAVRLLLAPARLMEEHAAADFHKQVDGLHEESCLQVSCVFVRLFVVLVTPTTSGKANMAVVIKFMT